MPSPRPERQNTQAEFWTLDQSARHFGVTRATIERYIREGLPVYFQRRFLRPKEVIAWRMAKQSNLLKSQMTRRTE